MSYLILPRELLILISNYEPKIILLSDCPNWNMHSLIKQNFGLEFSINIPYLDIKKLYYEYCMKHKSIFNGNGCTIIKLFDTLMGCGDNGYGQLGHGASTSITKFDEIKGIHKNIYDVICGGYHTIIKLTDNTLMNCGDHSDGQLGHDKTYSTRFEKVKWEPKK